jgi:hypothetical protein
MANGQPSGLWDAPFISERDRELRKAYAMLAAWTEAIMAEQDGACPICGASQADAGRSFPLDHDHTPPHEVYGLPCDGCNRLLTPELRARLLAYLTDPPARRVGMRLFGQPFRIPAARIAKLEVKAAKRRAKARSATPAASRAASAVRRVRRNTRQAAETERAAEAGQPGGYGAQLAALTGRADQTPTTTTPTTRRAP